MASINFPPQRVDWRVELLVSAEHSEKLSAENNQPEPQRHETRWRYRAQLGLTRFLCFSRLEIALTGP